MKTFVASAVYLMVLLGIAAILFPDSTGDAWLFMIATVAFVRTIDMEVRSTFKPHP